MELKHFNVHRPPLHQGIMSQMRRLISHPAGLCLSGDFNFNTAIRWEKSSTIDINNEGQIREMVPKCCSSIVRVFYILT